MTDTMDKAHRFFQRYGAALLARDERAMARMYAVPSLILFPGRSIAVSHATQTEEFFAASWSQYDGVESVDKRIVVMGEAPGSLSSEALRSECRAPEPSVIRWTEPAGSGPKGPPTLSS